MVQLMTFCLQWAGLWPKFAQKVIRFVLCTVRRVYMEIEPNTLFLYATKSRSKLLLLNNLSMFPLRPSSNLVFFDIFTRGLLHKKIFYLFDKGDFRTSIQCFGATSSRIRHAS